MHVDVNAVNVGKQIFVSVVSVCMSICTYILYSYMFCVLPSALILWPLIAVYLPGVLFCMPMWHSAYSIEPILFWFALHSPQQLCIRVCAAVCAWIRAIGAPLCSIVLLQKLFETNFMPFFIWIQNWLAVSMLLFNWKCSLVLGISMGCCFCF